MSHLIKMTNQNPTTQWLDSTIFTDKALTTAVAFCKYGPVNGETLCITDPLQGVSPVTLAPNTAYYLVISNEHAMTPQPVTFTLQVVPFDPLTGCTTGGTDCFTFESGAADPRTLTSSGSNGTGLWSRSTTTSGSGTQSLTSGISQKSQDSSCVQFTATDVKWISFSFKAPFVSTSETLHFNIDTSLVEFWYNPKPWQRVLYPGAAGTHVYQWCYEKQYYTDGFDNVFLDDIELNY